jgi:hypothetical protein
MMIYVSKCHECGGDSVNGPICCACDDRTRNARAAQGTEAQRATNAKHGVVHDGPVSEGNAP